MLFVKIGFVSIEPRTPAARFDELTAYNLPIESSAHFTFQIQRRCWCRCWLQTGRWGWHRCGVVRVGWIEESSWTFLWGLGVCAGWGQLCWILLFPVTNKTVYWLRDVKIADCCRLHVWNRNVRSEQKTEQCTGSARSAGHLISDAWNAIAFAKQICCFVRRVLSR